MIENSIPNGKKLHGDIISDFLNDIANNIGIPNAVIYYSSVITTQEEWISIYIKFQIS